MPLVTANATLDSPEQMAARVWLALQAGIKTPQALHCAPTARTQNTTPLQGQGRRQRVRRVQTQCLTTALPVSSVLEGITRLIQITRLAREGLLQGLPARETKAAQNAQAVNSKAWWHQMVHHAFHARPTHGHRRFQTVRQTASVSLAFLEQLLERAQQAVGAVFAQQTLTRHRVAQLLVMRALTTPSQCRTQKLSLIASAALVTLALMEAHVQVVMSASTKTPWGQHNARFAKRENTTVTQPRPQKMHARRVQTAQILLERVFLVIAPQEATQSVTATEAVLLRLD